MKHQEEMVKVLVGYIRVSTEEQHTIRQEVLMKELGVEKVYIDKMSGKNADRPALKEMLGFVRNGDTIVTSEISRLARNTKDLLTIVSELEEKGVVFKSNKERIDTSTEMGRFLIMIFGAVAELERNYLLSRQKEGIRIAKQQGKYKGRKRIEVQEFGEIYCLWKDKKISGKRAMEILGLKPNTFYRRVKEYEKR